MRFCSLWSAPILVGLVLGIQGCAAPSKPALEAPTALSVEPRIVTAEAIATESELALSGERALREQRWKDAVSVYRTLVSADPQSPRVVDYLFDLGLALEGAQERVAARDAFLELAARFPESPHARRALIRGATLDAYIEEWPSLRAIGDTLLARTDIDVVDRIVALGARGLARVELGEDTAASKDILDGLELGDGLHYGDRDVLPVAIAQLRFALGELRRIRSERIHFDPLPPDFVDQLETRCAGMLSAQAAYAQAARSVDPHWAAMAGYRVGAMYRALHRELMSIPAPEASKSDRQKKVFFAFMHIRYRVLLEKGLREIDQTLALAKRTGDDSAWIARAQEAKDEMQGALAAEQAQIDSLPFREVEVKAALDRMERRATTSPPPSGNLRQR